MIRSTASSVQRSHFAFFFSYFPWFGLACQTLGCELHIYARKTSQPCYVVPPSWHIPFSAHLVIDSALTSEVYLLLVLGIFLGKIEKQIEDARLRHNVAASQ